MSARADQLPMREGVIVDQHGNPITRLHTYHYGADLDADELRGWYPQEASADGELLPELKTLRARTRDLIRNHGLTSGAVQTHLDNVVGPNLRLSLKPDWRALGISREAGREWARNTEAKFYAWANDLGCYCDAARRHTFNGLLSMAYRSYLTSFESLATIEWLPDRPGAKYATAIQQLDPALLSNPDGTVNGEHLREGVVLGDMGEAVGYWFASHLVNDPMMQQRIRKWRYVPRETPWGRQLVVHVFDGDMPGQSRGKTGIVSIIAQNKMLQKFQQVSLQAAILNAMYAAVIESPFDWELAGAALGVRNDRATQSNPVDGYMKARAAFHKDGFIRYNGVKIPHLYPGEKFELKAAQHPTAAFQAFEECVLRHLAAGFNMTYEQFSRDYSKTNYSSARAAMIEAWRFFSGRRYFIGARIATQYFAAWLEEAMDSGDVETPAGAPDFYDAKSAYTRCTWIGPGKGHIDPLKEEQAATVAFANGTTTFEKECAERGLDWEEVLEQQAYEKARKRELEAEYGVQLTMGGADPAPAAAAANVPTDEEIDEAVAEGAISEEDAEELRASIETYGVAVRAGTITPQTADEEHFRSRLKLPSMSGEAREAWAQDQGTRRPVTLTPPPGDAPAAGPPQPGEDPADEADDDTPDELEQEGADDNDDDADD